ncbi:MAG: cache domain-containing protein [Candidatus Marinimicrobia bacterium]|nr:cache domain-containing protein [Candidatus Neomarinimicrobiota bacterium]
MHKEKKTSFIKYLKLWAIITSVLFGSLIIGIDIISARYHLKNQSDITRKKYIDAQKKMIKNEVEIAVDLINHYTDQIQNVAKDSINNKLKGISDIDESSIGELLEDISRIRFGKEGYIFINKFDGMALVSNGKKLSGKKKLWEEFDDNPEYIKDLFQMEYKAAIKPQGDYIYYTYQKLTSPHINSPKTSYIYGIPELQWLIGAGVYLDDVEADIAVMRKNIYEETKRSVIYFIILILFIITVFLLLISILHQKLKKDFDHLAEFFERLALSNIKIDRDTIRFIEFNQLVESANKMLSEKIEAQEDLKATVKAIPDILFEIDCNNRIQWLSTPDDKLLYMEPEKFIGKEVKEILPPHASDIIMKALDDTRKQGFHKGSIFDLDLPDGKKWNEINIARKGRENKKGYSCIASIRNITERKNAEEKNKQLEVQIQQKQKLESMGIFAGGIAHDFNNIFTEILGNLDLAKMELEMNHPILKYIQGIEKSLDRAIVLSKQMLTYSGKGQIIVETLNLNELISNMMQLFKSAISKKVKLELDLSKTIGNIKVDKKQIHQIVINLLSNASEAIGDTSGMITISSGQMHLVDEQLENNLTDAKIKDGEYVFFEVRDTGCGMNKQIVDKIFDPFFSTKFTGRGLGLSAVSGIIKAHNGFANIQSETGTGTSFKVFFPAVSTEIESIKKIEEVI